MSLGKRVEAARRSLGKTRAELARELGMLSPSALRDLEILNSTPNRLQELLPLLARALNTSVGFLITGQTPSSTPILTEVDQIESACRRIKRHID